MDITCGTDNQIRFNELINWDTQVCHYPSFEQHMCWIVLLETILNNRKGITYLYFLLKKVDKHNPCIDKYCDSIEKKDSSKRVHTYAYTWLYPWACGGGVHVPGKDKLIVIK